MPVPSTSPVRLTLYLAGNDASARRARESLGRISKSLSATVRIEIVDVLENPGRAELAGIIATPTLSQDDSDPPRRIVGDFSDFERVSEFFGLVQQEPD